MHEHEHDHDHNQHDHDQHDHGERRGHDHRHAHAAAGSRAIHGAFAANTVLLVVQVLLGGVLLAAGYAPKGDLHVLYGLLPIVVLFFAEQLRIGSAQAILDSRGFDSAQDVGTLPEDQQRSVVLAIVRREIGTMTLAAIVCAGLVVRAGAVSGHLF